MDKISNIQILQTLEYSLFSNIIGNRNVNLSKVEKLVSDVNSGFNMLPYCPIIVSEKDGFLNIIDGQHRFEVSKKSLNPVYYVVCNTLSLQKIAMLNSRGQKWSMNDFLNCYLKLDIDDYKILKETLTVHKGQIATIASLLMLNDVKKNIKEHFESGEFKVNFLKETEKILLLTEKLFGQYNFSRDRYLIGAMQKIDSSGKCDYDILIDKIKQNPMGIDKQNDIKNYIYNIERVYNFKNRERQTII